eukprot:1232354-Rhodomonas_salina.2
MSSSTQEQAASGSLQQWGQVSSTTLDEARAAAAQATRDKDKLYYTTLKSKMYATIVPPGINIVFGSEECWGKFGKWIKVWVKGCNESEVDAFSKVWDDFQPFKTYDPQFRYYKGAWAPSARVCELYVKGVLGITAFSLLTTKSALMVSFPKQCVATLVVMPMKDTKTWHLTGPTYFLDYVYSQQYSFTFNTSIRRMLTEAVQCNAVAKDIYVKLTEEFEICVLLVGGDEDGTDAGCKSV